MRPRITKLDSLVTEVLDLVAQEEPTHAFNERLDSITDKLLQANAAYEEFNNRAANAPNALIQVNAADEEVNNEAASVPDTLMQVNALDQEFNNGTKLASIPSLFAFKRPALFVFDVLFPMAFYSLLVRDLIFYAANPDERYD